MDELDGTRQWACSVFRLQWNGLGASWCQRNPFATFLRPQGIGNLKRVRGSLLTHDSIQMSKVYVGRGFGKEWIDGVRAVVAGRVDGTVARKDANALFWFSGVGWDSLFIWYIYLCSISSFRNLTVWKFYDSHTGNITLNGTFKIGLFFIFRPAVAVDISVFSGISFLFLSFGVHIATQWSLSSKLCYLCHLTSLLATYKRFCLSDWTNRAQHSSMPSFYYRRF